MELNGLPRGVTCSTSRLRPREGCDFKTESPTTHAQHIYIARELQRLGVRWVSLAPRYIGRFEKGVDYIGDVSEFDADLADHAAIARTISPDGRYKLSLHSGSDKFTIYPAFVRQTRGLTHLKTAGTSYLEALRTIAALDAGLFREVGFNDDTRAFASIRARHDVWRRVTCDWLAGMVVTGVLDEEEAGDMAREFAYGLARKTYRLEREPVRKP